MALHICLLLFIRVPPTLSLQQNWCIKDSRTDVNSEECFNRRLQTFSALETDFENGWPSSWIEESQDDVRWDIEDYNSPWEMETLAPLDHLNGKQHIRVNRGVTFSFGVAVLRSKQFLIPSTAVDFSFSFSFWIRSKWPQFTNLEVIKTTPSG